MSLAAMVAPSPVKTEVREALGCIYERSIARVTNPEEESTLSGSYALAVRRRARHSTSEASLSNPGSPAGPPESPLAKCATSAHDDLSEGDSGQTRTRAHVTTHRRGSLTTSFNRSEASISEPVAPVGEASESLRASCRESSESECDDSSEGEPDETYQKASVRTRRRATCFRNRRASMLAQLEGGLPRLLGGVVVVDPESPGKKSESLLGTRHESSEEEDDASFGSSEAELDEENRRVGATTLRRSTLETQRRFTRRSSQSAAWDRWDPRDLYLAADAQAQAALKL